VSFVNKFYSILFCLFTLGGFSQEGVVSEVEILGLKRTKLSFVQKLINVKEGVELDSLMIQKDIRKLNRLVAIANATYSITKTTNNNYKVVYQIEENLTIIPQANVWTVNKKLSYSVGLYEYNLLGRNIKIGGFYQNNGFDSYGASFNAPFLFSKSFGLGFSYQNWTSEEPLYFDNLVANYKYNNEFYELTGMFQLTYKNSISLGVNLFTENYAYLNGDDSINTDVVPLSLRQDKSMLKFGYVHDNLKYDYYLLSGFKSVLNVQSVATEGDYGDLFLFGLNDFLYFKRIGLKGNFATRLRFGIATNNETPFAPFALDNNLNIRGVGNTIDRGSASVVWNLEYRQTVIEKGWFVLQANAFMDAGSWRDPGGNLSDITNPDKFRVFAGGGLRFMHKRIYNAIFRVDYGYGITDKNSSGLVIGIGQYF
jgi:outer membrane protein assembly factor BamA